MSYDGNMTVRIGLDDLRVVSEALMLRFPLRAPESRRVARMRELLECSGELGRAIGTQTHTGRVHCQGSHGIGDLSMATESVQSALVAWASLVQEIAAEYRGVVDGAALAS